MKVVCIADGWNLNNTQKNWSISLPVKGVTYTIRTIEEISGQIFYRLNEIINPEYIGWTGTVPGQGAYEKAEVQFTSVAFRRLTDISALQSLTVIKTKKLEEV